MGAHGPPPTPTAILRLRGSWRAKLNPEEPKTPVSRPPCPGILKGRERRRYRSIGKQLEELGVISQLDEGALARLCALEEEFLQTLAFIREQGRTVEVPTAAGPVTKLRPEVPYLLGLASEIRQIETHFGLTPSARTRLKATQDPEREKDDRKRSYVSIA